MISRFLIFSLVSFPVQVLAVVTWDRPAAGDVYTPGDTLQAVWTTADNIPSPSFTICTADNSSDASNNADCGTAVWPTVDNNGTEFSISLFVPNITGNGDYYLVMKDDQDNTYDSPNFSLALPNIANATDIPDATSGLAATVPTGTNIEYLPSHSASTVTAIAVPLSLVAVTLLAALLLLLSRLQRSKRREKDKQVNYENFASQSTLSFASATDIERAVLALAAARGYSGLGSRLYIPPQPVNQGIPFAMQNWGSATAPPAMRSSASGWSHEFGGTPSAAPVMPDAYTPIPVPQHVTGSSGGSMRQQYPMHLVATSTSSSQRSSLSQGEIAHSSRETDLRRTDWRDINRIFMNEAAPRSPSVACGPPQLPEIQRHTSSPPWHGQDSHPPPPPPKQLIPGSPLDYAPNPRNPLSAGGLPLTPGSDAHASLNVISNYMRASPVLPQGDSFLAPSKGDFQEPRAPPSSMTRWRSLRRLETIPEGEKPLPTRPEDRVGTSLYDAVSKAVGR